MNIVINILNNQGRKIGSVSEMGGRKTYLDSQGRLAARVFDSRTFNDKGRPIGTGDQGMRTLFGKVK
jgi:hypothetical protein